MTRETWMHDLRRVDEITLKSCDAIREVEQYGKGDTAVLRMLYWLAVAVWHLLEDKIKGAKP